MQRIVAILALVSLLAVPAAAWPAGNCCCDCCKSGICLMHARHAKQAAPDEEMPCHGTHHAAEPATKCDGAPQCSQRAQAVSVAPLPPGVLAAAPVVEAPRASRDSVAMSDLQAVRGFVLLPFLPPRLTA
ncbi:MAG TPA: hypothetical protein VJX29_08900 [Candidatus Acidoferrales bacterium]|nr:hypothetical protein [Candidatus Acidoferrales bacterium]